MANDKTTHPTQILADESSSSSSPIDDKTQTKQSSSSPTNHYGNTLDPPPVSIPNGTTTNKEESHDASSSSENHHLPPPSNHHSTPNKDATYVNLLKTNRAFRLYLASYFITLTGQWFTYVATLSFIETLLPESYTVISLLIAIRLAPYLLFSFIGGALADARDRRHSMIALDCCSAFVALLYLMVLNTESLSLLYGVVLLQQTLGGLYEPVRCAILPMLVEDVECLKKATTLASLAWSVMAALGSGVGGVFAARLGWEACFVVDGFTFLLSAFLMYLIGGTWNPSPPKQTTTTTTQHETTTTTTVTISSLYQKSKSMTIDVLQYLKSSHFSTLILLKASGAMIYGVSDILNVAFSERINDPTGNSERLGILMACVGFGCVIGPLVADPLTDAKDPRTLQIACVGAFAVMALGCLGLGYFTQFWSVGCFTFLRSTGSSVLWINSSLLLQIFCANDMLGRVSALDIGFATVSEAISALIAGLLQDDFGLSAREVAYIMSCVGMFAAVVWTIFHRRGGGAANTSKNDSRKSNDGNDSKITESDERARLLREERI